MYLYVQRHITYMAAQVGYALFFRLVLIFFNTWYFYSTMRVVCIIIVAIVLGCFSWEYAYIPVLTRIM